MVKDALDLSGARIIGELLLRVLTTTISCWRIISYLAHLLVKGLIGDKSEGLTNRRSYDILVHIIHVGNERESDM